jgi:Raf kinase inhibitor-like YbhB/YbcL family protein
LSTINCFAHIIGDPVHDSPIHYLSGSKPPTNIVFTSAGLIRVDTTNRAAFVAAAFQPFSPLVKTHADSDYFYVESDGMPTHRMMVGITAWQQQVPLPQSYFGDNAWRFPLWPVVATNPISAKTHFFRGAIAIAVNGVPIFNPIKNDGHTDTFLAGELDEYGGHAGRADDYHYHTAALHLQKIVGSNQPIAFALDGYPIYGLNEPDGSAPKNLDAFNGHETPQLGYHYHASTKYPYVNGGFHGQVTEREGQVDPQPRAQPVRPATAPLRGAVITDFQGDADGKGYTLTYTLNSQPVKLHYSAGTGAVKFEFTDSTGKTTTKNYPTNFREPHDSHPPSQKELNDDRSPQDGNRPPPENQGRAQRRDQPPMVAPVMIDAKRSGNFILTSSAVTNGGALPVEFTGDGASASPPLEWTGAPSGTKSFAVVMDHFPGPGDVKWYWTLYNIPASVHSLPKNARGIGVAGNNSVNRNLGYAPPHSKGPGAKTYFITVYALSAPLEISLPPASVNRNVLLTAMKDRVLDSAQLKFTYDRTRFIQQNGDERPPRRNDSERPNP